MKRKRHGWLAVLPPVLIVAFGMVLSGSTPSAIAQANACAGFPNLIVCENAKSGNPPSEWDVSGGGDPTIQGFATDISVNRGGTIGFKVDTDSANYRLDIYRMGYYNGLGARKVAIVQPSVALPQNQPNCLSDAATGLIDCGNWAQSASWTVPADAVSGIYFAKLVRESDNAGGSHIFFIVRHDGGNSDLLVQTSDTTWQAYNQYGGNSLYVGGPGTSPARAYKVSYNRPVTTRDCCPEDSVFNAEYPMVRWLEANGYNISYFSGIDTDRRGAEILNHRIFLSVGHDEYWSGAQRANVETARNAGVHLAFFSGNEIFWKTRWENSISSPSTAYRTLVSYKETHANAKIDPLPGVWTGTWRDPRFSPPADGGRPENALTGTIFTVNAGTTGIVVPEPLSKFRFWRNTSVATLAPGQVAVLADGTLGYEWDEDLDNGFRPAGTIALSETTVDGVLKLQDFGSTYAAGTATHRMTLYRHSSGALVFGAGTIQWSWGLDGNHSPGTSTPDIRMQQATVNLFADMAVQPATLRPGLTPATASSDVTKPVSAITSPANGATVISGATVTITGTASDAGGTVAAVEVSVNGGATWQRANGTTSWSFTWIPGAPGQATIKTSAVDDSGNVEQPGPGRTVTIAATQPCPCTIWSNATVPGNPAENDPSSVELGVRFRSDSNGFITGLRFYKAPGSPAPHILNLWSNGGTLLASVTTTNETASGWQTVTLPNSVAITANTTYVASYFTTGYAADSGYFSSAFVNPPLRALADGSDGPSGMYRYGSSSGFPTDTFGASNYWVDVVFNTTSTTPPDTTPPTVTAVTPTSGSSTATTSSNVTATFSEAMNAAAITTSTFELRTPTNALVAATVTYDPASGAATLDPTASLAASTTYTATVKGGSTGVRDVAGNALAANFTWSFTTAAPPVCPCTIWSPSAVPAVVSENDPSSVELGVRFRSDIAGFITGLRFYKAPGSPSPHVVKLWSNTGTLLATATSSGETASGWQQANLSSAVAISANTTYVASYHTTGYPVNSDYFGTSIVNGPLRALADGQDGPNGVYRYGASAFPTNTWAASNYWVDVVFNTTSTTPPDTTPPTVTTVTPVSGSSTAGPGSNVTVTFNEAMNATSITTSTFELRTPTNALVPAAVSYDPASLTATLNPTGLLAASTTYTATVRGGSTGVRDAAGNALAANFTWSFTTAIPCPCSIWSPGTVPAVVADGDGPVELGMRFRADTDGFITGLRFYKAAGSASPHIVNLWSNTGTLLATATSSNETAFGWQQVDLSSPVAVTADTTYVASYHTTGYVLNLNFFTTTTANGLLRALADDQDGPNGVYRYGASAFPRDTWASSNYWVDVVFNTFVPDTTPPTITTRKPGAGSVGMATSVNVSATFSEAIDPATMNASAFELRTAAGVLVPVAVAYNAGTRTATLDPTSALATSTAYTARVRGGASGVKDLAGNALSADVTWSFSTTAPAGPPPDQGPGGPILVVASPTNPFSRYYAEILRAEGLNAFAVANLSTVTATTLAAYDVVILGETTLTTSQVTMFTTWVNNGGNLIAMRPDKKLAALLGLTDTGTTLSNAYLLVNTLAAPGAGIVGQTMQFHGAADRYNVNGATAVAGLYTNATTPITAPAVTLRSVGVLGGQAAAFTYDLARSIVYTRQGNPAWAGQERDGITPMRSDDLFFGADPGDPQVDWVNLDKVAIPQADEQQRLLANLIIHTNRDRKPLPRFWYFPRDLKAAVVMTGDDHGNGGTVGRWDSYVAQSPAGCAVDNWECVRGTSYIYPNTAIGDATAASYQANGFELAVHVTTNCADYTPDMLADFYSTQLSEFAANFPSAAAPATNRTHCIVWSDWATQPHVALANGIRLDTNYYYYPPAWIANRPGFMTGSGMLMRFADLDGALIDVYQAATQMTDESGQTFPFTVDTLLDRALGTEGYFGFFTANMHTDNPAIPQDDAIVASALARGVPVISARQALEWTDGRNGSSFSSMVWSGNQLTFSIAIGQGANGLRAMLPMSTAAGSLSTLKLNGAPLTFTTLTVKGIQYAVFPAGLGTFEATYAGP